MVKILVIGDLHGRTPKIHTKDFDGIACVGDFGNDKEIAPYYKKMFKELKKNPEADTDINQIILNSVGKKEFEAMHKRSLKKGNKILKYLDSFGKPIFLVAGNWDQSYGPSRIKDLSKSDYNYLKSFSDWFLGDKINPIITKGCKNIKNCMFKLHKSNNLNFVGYGLSSGPEKKTKSSKRGSNLTFTKTEYKKLQKAHDKIKNKLEKAYKKRDKKFPTFFITHNIPYKTKLDKINHKGSYAHGKHNGSTIARDFCTKHQPLICIGGHIHEGIGKDKIKKTTIINPGFGQNAQVLVEIDEQKNKIKKIKFFEKKTQK